MEHIGKDLTWYIFFWYLILLGKECLSALYFDLEKLVDLPLGKGYKVNKVLGTKIG